jgi:hypothetical protein
MKAARRRNWPYQTLEELLKVAYEEITLRNENAAVLRALRKLRGQAVDLD